MLYISEYILAQLFNASVASLAARFDVRTGEVSARTVARTDQGHRTASKPRVWCRQPKAYFTN
jgi:hypothetical protein